MFTIKKLDNHIELFLSKLKKQDFLIDKVILYGSYAKGKPNTNSDIDLAIWLNNSELDEDFLLKTAAQFYPIHPKFYTSNDNIDNDPFIEIIEKTGRQIVLD